MHDNFYKKKKGIIFHDNESKMKNITMKFWHWLFVFYVSIIWLFAFDKIFKLVTLIGSSEH